MKKYSFCPPVLSPREAVELIPDGATIATSGFGVVLPNTLHRALGECFQETGAPRDLTYIHAAGFGEGLGLDMLAPYGMIRRVIGGHWGAMPTLREQIREEKIEAHNWPQGMVLGAFRAAACGEKNGLRSRIGLGTFVDPRQDGGCANQTARSAGSLIRLVEQEGEELLAYAPLEVDVALLRGWTADKQGNVSLGLEPMSMSLEIIAMAARNRGGKVLCQVRAIEDTIFPADRVVLPGFMIDALVIASDPATEHRQSTDYEADPALINNTTGTIGACQVPIPPVLCGPRGWIGRRAALEVSDGDVLNLGIGIPGDSVGSALNEAGRCDRVMSTLESGLFGGVALGELNFGVALYPVARVDQAMMFDLYHGGGLDISIMGAAQIDGRGNINVSQFSGRAVGCGGFIDITQSARRIVFCTTLTAGDLDARFVDGEVQIIQEGRHRKFVEQVGQISFNGQGSVERQQPVTVVTERCVFQLTEDGWHLTEVAPGISIERDILPNLDFTPHIGEVKPMPRSCFEGLCTPQPDDGGT